MFDFFLQTGVVEAFSICLFSCGTSWICFKRLARTFSQFFQRFTSTYLATAWTKTAIFLTTGWKGRGYLSSKNNRTKTRRFLLAGTIQRKSIAHKSINMKRRNGRSFKACFMDETCPTAQRSHKRQPLLVFLIQTTFGTVWRLTTI
jgi:hypothetical protein